MADKARAGAEERLALHCDITINEFPMRVVRGCQAQLAQRMKTSQPRVNRIEAGSPEVSLELLFKGCYALGGAVEVNLRGLRVGTHANVSVVGFGDPIQKGK